MALPDDITLNPTSFGGANVAKTYNFITEREDSSLRRVAATALVAPETLVIRHKEIVKGAITYDQHQVLISEVFNDLTKGTGTSEVWMVVKAPRGVSTVTVASLKDLIGRLIALEQSAGTIEKILNGES